MVTSYWWFDGEQIRFYTRSAVLGYGIGTIAAIAVSVRAVFEKPSRLLGIGSTSVQRLSDAHGNIGSSIVDVKIHTLLGKHRDALDALREAVDAGWRFWHNFHLDDPALRHLQSDPERTIRA